jgi:hypothetical protein
MGTREKLFRQKLADQIEGLLTQSEKVFTSEKLDNLWLNDMISRNQELNRALTIYQFLHDLPENEKLQVEFLELKEEEESNSEKEIPNYGDEILKEIDEFESKESVEVFEVVDETVENGPQEIEKPVETTTDSEDTETKVDETSTHKEVEIVIEEDTDENEPENILEVDEVTEKLTVEPEEEPESTDIIDSQEEVTTPEIVEAKTEETKKEINDAVANTTPSLADKLSTKSIQKLADSIALNERFLFSNELFNGNMEAFKRALTELDHIASKEDAHRYIEVQLQKENNWEMDSDTVQNFISLVDRRFN